MFFICFNDSPSKMMKNAFYFILKALSVLKIFKFLSWLFRHVESSHSLVNKELQHTYCSISHELKATMKFGKLIEHPKRNIFL